MLGKILKYEFKAPARGFFPLSGCLLLLAVLNVVMLKLNDFFQTNGANLLNIITVITTTLLVLYLIAIFIVTVILCIMRFYKNLLGDEGYLMNTLPVSAWTNIGGKLIVSVIWSVLSIMIIVLAGAVFAFGISNVTFIEFFQGLGRFFTMFSEEFGLDGWLAVFEFCILCLFSLVSFYCVVYASLAIGHSFTKHKMMFSVLAYIVFSIVENIISGFFIWVLNRIDMVHITVNHVKDVPHGFIWLLCAGIAVYAAVYYCISRYFLSKRLNLQ